MTPRTVGLMPFILLIPAFSTLVYICEGCETIPKLAKEWLDILICHPDDIFNIDFFISLEQILEKVPAALANFAPEKGNFSIELIASKSFIFNIFCVLPTKAFALFPPEKTLLPFFTFSDNKIKLHKPLVYIIKPTYPVKKKNGIECEK